jgi:hypothetical protein
VLGVVLLVCLALIATPATAGDHAIFICPPGKTKVWILYDDDNKFRAREADKKGEHKEEYFAGYVVEGRGGEKDKEFPFTSRLFRLDQTGKKGDILYYQGRRCVEADE